MSKRIETVCEMVERLYGGKTDAEKSCLCVGASAREAQIRGHLEAMVRAFATRGQIDAAATLQEYVSRLDGRAPS